MRKHSFRILSCAVACITLSFLVNSCKKDMHSSDDRAQKEVTTPRAVTYQLLWSDEFDGTGVNTNNWNDAAWFKEWLQLAGSQTA